MSDFFDTSREDLKNTIKRCLENKDLLMQLLNCLTAAKVSVETIGAALEEESDSSAMADALVLALSERLDFTDFCSVIENKDDASLLLEKYADAERVWFYLVNELFIHYDHNVTIINSYRKLLEAKRTQSIKKNKWGDIDDSDWAEVLIQFAEEKLLGGTFEIGLKALPLVLRAHLEKVNALNLLPRFIWVIFEVDKPVTNITDEKYNDSPKNGIAFELDLRHQIENNLPDAIVELTPRSGDQGADLIIYIRELKIVIQAKHYTGKVGNSAVQEVYAAKGFYDAHIGMVVTNSDFTQSARNLAAELGIMLVYDTQIIDLLKGATA